MVMRSSAVKATLYATPLPSTEEAHTQIHARPGRIVTLTMRVWLCLTLLIFGVVAMTRREVSPLVIDPPRQYLPGNPFPESASCDQPGDKYVLCSVAFSNPEIYVVVEESTHLIVRTLIQTREYTLGQLVAAWGTPLGVSKVGWTYVHWGMHSVLVQTPSLRFDSPSAYIVFDLEQPQALPWRGFSKSKP